MAVQDGAPNGPPAGHQLATGAGDSEALGGTPLKPSPGSAGAPDSPPKPVAEVPTAAPNRRARWFGPRRVLALFCYVLFLCYMDNGLLASNGITGTKSANGDTSNEGGMTADLNLSFFQLGLLPAMFMVGLMVACAAMSKLTAYISAFRLVGVGMTMWVLGAVFTGVAQNYGSLMFARVFMGAGEASLMTLSGPYVDDVAPPKQKVFWFALLSLGSGLGMAVGYVYGQAAYAIGWRPCFWIEAALGVPVALLFLFAPAHDLRGEGKELPSETAVENGKRLGFWAALRHSARLLWHEVIVLHEHPIFLANVWAYVPVQGLLGALTFWAPKAAVDILSDAGDSMDYVIGGMTVAAAVVGTLGGGYLLDRWGSSLANASLMQGVSCTVGLLASLLAFTVTHNLAAFAPAFAFVLLGLFVTSAPLYALSMWTVPIPQRPAAQAMQVILMHVLGDVPSPAIVGAIQGAVHNWRFSMSVITAPLALSVIVYAASTLTCRFAPRLAPDYREEVPGHTPLAKPADLKPSEVEKGLGRPSGAGAEDKDDLQTGAGKANGAR